MTSCRVTVILIAMLGLAAGARAQTAAAASPVPAAKIGVINPSKVFQDMKETKELRAKLEAKRQELQAIEGDKRKAIDDLKRARSNLKPDSPQYNDLSGQVDKATSDFQSWGQVTRLDAERQQKQMMKTLFDKIQVAVGEVAQQDGIDLVLSDQGQDVPGTEDLTFDQLRMLLNQRNIMYVSKRVDISERVLTVLDAQYAKEKEQK